MRSPRFDTPGWVFFNAITSGIFALSVIVQIYLWRRSDEKPSGWLWLAIAASIAVNGAYLPLGPLYALSQHRQIMRRNQLRRQSGEGATAPSGNAYARRSPPVDSMTDGAPMIATTEPIDQTSRRLATFAHFGVPIYGPILPLIMWKRYRNDPFVRTHAFEALCFQVAVIAVWIPIVIAMALGLTVAVPIAFLVAAFVVECVQARRSMTGRSPLSLVSLAVRH